MVRNKNFLPQKFSLLGLKTNLENRGNAENWNLNSISLNFPDLMFKCKKECGLKNACRLLQLQEFHLSWPKYI